MIIKFSAFIYFPLLFREVVYVKELRLVSVNLILESIYVSVTVTCFQSEKLFVFSVSVFVRCLVLTDSFS